MGVSYYQLLIINHSSTDTVVRRDVHCVAADVSDFKGLIQVVPGFRSLAYEQHEING